MVKKKEYQVEAIIGKRRMKKTGIVQYRVLWLGYPTSEATWEPEENLINIKQMIDQFNFKLQQKNYLLKNIPNSEAKTGNSIPQTSPMQSISTNISTNIINENLNKNSPITLNLNENPLTTANLISFNNTQKMPNEVINSQKIYLQSTQKIIQKQPKTEFQCQEKNNQNQDTFECRSAIKKSMRGRFRKNKIQIQREIKPTQQLQTFQKDQEEQMEQNQESTLLNYEIAGMFVDEKGNYCYSVLDIKANLRLIMTRNEIVKLQPLALIIFYQSNINILS